MPKGGSWDRNPELKLRQPWPKGVRFSDARTERILDQRRPPKPVAQSYGSAGAACVAARFAESEVDAGNQSPTLSRHAANELAASPLIRACLLSRIGDLALARALIWL
jgi:hypothetical protein